MRSKRSRSTHLEHYRLVERAKSSKRRATLKQVAVDSDVTSEALDALYRQQKGRCRWCGQKIKGPYHADHVVPISRGGPHTMSNIVIACPSCNSSKKDKLPSEWKGMLF